MLYFRSCNSPVVCVWVAKNVNTSFQLVFPFSTEKMAGLTTCPFTPLKIFFSSRLVNWSYYRVVNPSVFSFPHDFSILLHHTKFPISFVFGVLSTCEEFVIGIRWFPFLSHLLYSLSSILWWESSTEQQRSVSCPLLFLCLTLCTFSACPFSSLTHTHTHLNSNNISTIVWTW